MHPSLNSAQTGTCQRKLKRFGAAVLLAGVMASSVHAHGDEDHGAAPATPATAPQKAVAVGAANPTAAQRLPDGSLWMPKAVQYRLGVRTTLVHDETHVVGVELNGRVLSDPNAGGRVQASQGGRIEGGPQGLPTLGQRVRKGQVLAYLRPVASTLERGNQVSALADLDAQLAVAERRASRYDQLEGAVPQKDIQAARDERDGLRKRRAAIAGSLSASEALVAPASGVISAANVTLGQVVDSKEILFEVVDPSRLMVEALVYDPRQVAGLSDASLALPGGSVSLQWVGGSAQLREQAMPVLFRVQQSHAPLAVGQAVKVIAKTTQSVTGMALPREALVRTPAGEVAVWVHQAAEHFSSRVVKVVPLDAARVVITTGRHDRDRVVTAGASLLSQVR